MHPNDQNSYKTFGGGDDITFSNLEQDEEQHPLYRLFRSFGVKIVTQPVEEEEIDDECDFDIRMTDVPEEVLEAYTEPDILEVRIATIGKQFWTRTPRKRLLASVLLLTLVALLVSISSFGHATLSLFPLFSGTPQVKQSLNVRSGVSFDFPASYEEENYLSFGPNSSVMVTARPIPNYCATGTMLGQGRQIGNFPVWSVGIDDAATVHLPPLMLPTIINWKGWVIPLHVRGRYNYVSSISLTVFNLNDASSPLLQDRYTPVADMHLFLDTKHVTSVTGTGLHAIGTWDVSLYIPNAGCYGLSASWGRGHWLINFAAGK